MSTVKHAYHFPYGDLRIHHDIVAQRVRVFHGPDHVLDIRPFAGPALTRDEAPSVFVGLDRAPLSDDAEQWIDDFSADLDRLQSA